MQTDPTLVVAILWVARTVIGITFLVSGAAKLRDLQSFVAGAIGYQVLPARATRSLAHVLPFFEIGLGVALLAGVAPRATAALSLLLTVAFGMMVGVNLYRGRSIPCYCLGVTSREVIGFATLARLGALGIAASLLFTYAQAVPRGRPPFLSSWQAAIPLISTTVAVGTLLLLLSPLEIVARGVIVAWRASRQRSHQLAGAEAYHRSVDDRQDGRTTAPILDWK